MVLETVFDKNDVYNRIYEISVMFKNNRIN